MDRPSEALHPVTQSPEFTRKNREWFSQRYDFASQGIYFPHQPIYGFSRFEEHIQDYFRTYHILRLLEQVRFSNFLDVGCAEGYLVNAVRRLFGAECYGIDIAASGVRRARELYGIPGAAADALHLPFPDKTFDVVLSSETLEHVANPGAVISELLRVTRHYLILSTPAARDETTLEEHFRHVDPEVIHSHFHFFTERQMRAWLPPETLFLGVGHRSMQRVFGWFSSGYDQAAAISDLTRFVVASCPGMARETIAAYHRHADELTVPPPWWRRQLLGPRALALALRLDYRLAARHPEQTLAFLTLTPCDGVQLRLRRRPVPGLLRFLLRENRVDPLLLRNQNQ
jgi:SAM-dependent methyltransferase